MENKLIDLLRVQKDTIASAWIEKLLCSYPEEGAKFFKNQKNQFSNPVGHTIYENVPAIFKELTGGNNRDRLKDLLREIIKIRAVQEFSPSEAIRFVFLLKEVIGDVLQLESFKKLSIHDVQEFDAIIDETALIAFDLYMESREKLFRLRLKEANLRRAEALAIKTDNG